MNNKFTTLLAEVAKVLEVRKRHDAEGAQHHLDQDRKRKADQAWEITSHFLAKLSFGPQQRQVLLQVGALLYRAGCYEAASRKCFWPALDASKHAAPMTVIDRRLKAQVFRGVARCELASACSASSSQQHSVQRQLHALEVRGGIMPVCLQVVLQSVGSCACKPCAGVLLY